jgi:AcrR family transcriptional regulator
MKTRDRILQTSLELFNELGEPNVTTNHIADEMDISPGNLYYHFRNKDEIIYLLFERFERQMGEMLEAPQSRPPDMEDMWLYLHLVFESIWEYRFLYRDLNNLLSRNRKLHTHFRRIVARKISTAVEIFQGLADIGVMEASAEQREALANNIALAATYWLNFQSIFSPYGQGVESEDIGRGVYQVMAMVAPFLSGNAQELLESLSHDYLAS